jgi:hypothetical protein
MPRLCWGELCPLQLAGDRTPSHGLLPWCSTISWPSPCARGESHRRLEDGPATQLGRAFPASAACTSNSSASSHSMQPQGAVDAARCWWMAWSSVHVAMRRRPQVRWTLSRRALTSLCALVAGSRGQDWRSRGGCDTILWPYILDLEAPLDGTGRMVGVELSMKELTTIPAHGGHVTSLLFRPFGRNPCLRGTGRDGEVVSGAPVEITPFVRSPREERLPVVLLCAGSARGYGLDGHPKKVTAVTLCPHGAGLAWTGLVTHDGETMLGRGR